MIEATLNRPGTIAAAGINLTHRTPTLALCRALVDAGHPDQPMTVVDGATGKPVLNVASIFAAAEMTVLEEPGTRFAKYRPFDRENIDARALRSPPGSREGARLGNDGGNDE